MSLIDAVCLGRFASTAQLAALGPSSVIFNFSSYVFNALGIATTASVSSRLAAGDSHAASELATSALLVAIACGIVSCLVLQAYGPQLVAATKAVPELQALATSYLKVRAFAQPALLVCIVTQSALLAQRDSRSPALAVALQVAANASLDVALIVYGGAGIVGAAWGTVAAQYLGMLLLLQRLGSSGRVRFVHDFHLAQSLAQLWATLAPLSVLYIARNLCYMLLQVAAAALAPVQLAAHQAVWTCFNIAAFSTATLEQAGLSFIPGAKSSREKVATVRIMIGLGVGLGAILGAVCCGVCLLAPAAFSADVLVQQNIQTLAPLCGGVLVIVGADVAATAALIANGRASFVARSLLITLAALIAFMQAVRALQWGLLGVWAGLIFFFSLRCVQSFLGLNFFLRQR